VKPGTLLLGVDGGGSHCRARLCALDGVKLGEAVAGPANIRFGIDDSLAAVLQATQECLQQAGLSYRDLPRITACLALAGASEPREIAAAQARAHPFGRTVLTTDARAACVGAHCGRPGGIIVVGTGTIGWAELGERHHRVGGWGFPISDEGSGAWIGCEALRRVLWAHDSRISWTTLLSPLFERFKHDPHAIVRFSSEALPRDLGTLAPFVVEHAKSGDSVGIELMRAAAGHIDLLAERLHALGGQRLALVGGLAAEMTGWVSHTTRARLVAPTGDALDGALRLARAAADAAQAGGRTGASE
jgi:glucosamine kinase